jgi:hypothetical protein
MARRTVVRVTEQDADERLVELVAGFYADPWGFVRAMFPWGEAGTSLHNETGPDEWQAEVLGEISRRIRDGASDQEAIRIAVGSGHGVGKSALVAWVILWFISTRHNPQIVVTANTAAQLTTKTWRELAKWHKLCLNDGWFQWSATKFYLKASPETWCANAITWSKERAEAFAGTHEKHVLLLFDEASAIDDAIWEVAEGALTTAGAIMLVFGNGTRNTGRFRECFRRFRHRWWTKTVDSRTAKKANRKQIQQWAEDYGEDSDFFRVRVLGDFPRAASSQFIAEDLVENAQARYRQLVRRKRDGLGELADLGARVEVGIEDAADEWAPLIFSVDVARFGDDETVFGFRRGKLFVRHAKYRGLDTTAVAALAAEAIEEYRPDAIFVDANGVGAGVADQLTQLGYEIIEVMGQAKALDERKYFNRRVEMYDSVRRWLKDGGIIEDDTQFRDDLVGPEYGFDGKGRFQLESKDDMKARGLPSPDTGDCLAQTFYMPVARKNSGADLLSRIDADRWGATSFMSA